MIPKSIPKKTYNRIPIKSLDFLSVGYHSNHAPVATGDEGASIGHEQESGRVSFRADSLVGKPTANGFSEGVDIGPAAVRDPAGDRLVGPDAGAAGPQIAGHHCSDPRLADIGVGSRKKKSEHREGPSQIDHYRPLA